MLALTLFIALVGIDPNAGTTGFDFLQLTPTAREAAMGGAAIGSAPSPMGFWFSPAHARWAEKPRAQVGYLNYVAGVQTGGAQRLAQLEDQVDGRGGDGVRHAARTP